MNPEEDWDAHFMFNRYVLDYLEKKNLHATAEIFKNEAKIFDIPIATDVPDGFLHEWWLTFYDTFKSIHQKNQNVGGHLSAQQKNQNVGKPPTATRMNSISRQQGPSSSKTVRDERAIRIYRNNSSLKPSS